MLELDGAGSFVLLAGYVFARSKKIADHSCLEHAHGFLAARTHCR